MTGTNARGQASLEVVAGIPMLALAGLLALQLLLAGYATSLADGAAESAALAMAAGGHPRKAARAALPGWARERAKVVVGRSQVEVTLPSPSPLDSLSRRLAARSVAHVREAP